jgi:nitrogen-specific signal transduction histidine kinase
MDEYNLANGCFAIHTEEEYRKLAYMFPEYIFLDSDYSIYLAGRSVEELLNYTYNFLRDKSVNYLSETDDLKSSIMIQISENFFEWRSYNLRTGKGVFIQVEMCGFKITNAPNARCPIAIRLRRSRNHLDETSNPEVDKLTYWIAHNLRGPLATIEGLINLAKNQNNTSEMVTYLNYMSDHAQRLDEKIQLMIRLAAMIPK